MNELVPFEQIERMAQVMGKGKMFGKTADDLLPLMLIAQAEGKHPAIAAQEYDIIQGRPAINSRSALARFQSAGGSIKWISRTDEKASAILSHPQGGELEVTWTMERAKKAELTGKDNWKKYPAQMLAARVVAEGVRAIYPACLSGMYLGEEVADFDLPPSRSERPPRNVTPTKEEEPVVSIALAEPSRDDKVAEIKALIAELALAEEDVQKLRDLYGSDLDQTLSYLRHKRAKSE